MVAPVSSQIKENMKSNLPMISDKRVPMKKSDMHKVLAIKLPLDIDISIERDYHCGVALLLIATALLFSVPFLFVFSYHRQLQLYKSELADLRLKVSELDLTAAQLGSTSESISAVSQEVERSVSEVLSLVRRCDCKRTKGKGIARQKRDVQAVQNMAVKAENDVNDYGQDSASNDTMRGAVRAAHFKGLLPEKVVEAGQIGPWYEDKQAVGDFGLRTCNLRDRGVKLIVNETGLYLIYAQVYYLTSKSLNSFSININPENKSASIPVAFCSANASLNDQGASEVSCYTSIVRSLQAGDAISLQQQERQRRLIMREGHSFIGLVRLS